MTADVVDRVDGEPVRGHIVSIGFEGDLGPLHDGGRPAGVPPAVVHVRVERHVEIRTRHAHAFTTHESYRLDVGEARQTHAESSSGAG